MDVLIVIALVTSLVAMYVHYRSMVSNLDKRVKRIEGRLSAMRDAIDGWKK